MQCDLFLTALFSEKSISIHNILEFIKRVITIQYQYNNHNTICYCSATREK